MQTNLALAHYFKLVIITFIAGFSKREPQEKDCVHGWPRGASKDLHQREQPPAEAHQLSREEQHVSWWSVESTRHGDVCKLVAVGT